MLILWEHIVGVLESSVTAQVDDEEEDAALC